MYIRKFEAERGTRRAHTHTHTLYSPIYIMKMASTYFRYFILSSYPPVCVSVCSSFLCGSVFRLFITFTSFVVSFVSWPSFYQWLVFSGRHFLLSFRFVSFLLLRLCEKPPQCRFYFLRLAFIIFHVPCFPSKFFFDFISTFPFALVSTIHIEPQSLCVCVCVWMRCDFPTFHNRLLFLFYWSRFFFSLRCG